MEDLVSIIIPVYNSEKTIQRCIEAVLNQSYKNIEVIIVDDGSTDNTNRICNIYTDKHKVKVFHQENRGVSVARNKGLDLAQGAYIFFVDSDDVVGKNYIEELMRWKEFDYVTAGFKQELANGIWIQRIFQEEDVESSEIRKYPSKYIGKYYFGSPWAKVYKKSLIDKFGLRFDIRISNGEDTMFNIEYLAHANKVKIVPYCEYMYHYYENSLVRKVNIEQCEWRIQVEEKISYFFDMTSLENKEFFYERWFKVLYDLLHMVSFSLSDKELKNIFNNPFFADCIAWKRKTGNKEEKILIFFMQKGSFSMYEKIVKVLSIVGKVKKKYLN